MTGFTLGFTSLVLAAFVSSREPFVNVRDDRERLDGGGRVASGDAGRFEALLRLRARGFATFFAGGAAFVSGFAEAARAERLGGMSVESEMKTDVSEMKGRCLLLICDDDRDQYKDSCCPEEE